MRPLLTARVTLLVVLPLVSACKPPPPAPEGLDAATSYLVREFYSADDVFQAGLVGYMNWFDDEGYLLAGARATSENTDAFTVGDLSEEDIAQLPIVSDRDIEDTAGVVSLAEMDCTVPETEDLLVRPDQYNVFADDWTTYERTYLNERELWQGATSTGDYARIVDDLTPYEGGTVADLSEYATALMPTANRVNPEPELGGLADLDEYDLFLDFRHGVFDLNGEDLMVFAILSFQVDTIESPSGDSYLHQTYGLEVNVERPEGRTLRMLAVWSEIEGAGLTSDATLVLNYSVNKALDSSDRISGICAGEIEIPAEE